MVPSIGGCFPLLSFRPVVARSLARWLDAIGPYSSINSSKFLFQRREKIKLEGDRHTHDKQAPPAPRCPSQPERVAAKRATDGGRSVICIISSSSASRKKEGPRRRGYETLVVAGCYGYKLQTAGAKTAKIGFPSPPFFCGLFSLFSHGNVPNGYIRMRIKPVLAGIMHTRYVRKSKGRLDSYI